MIRTTDSLETYFAETKIPLRLSCVTESGWPVVLSLWYLFEDSCLYCATPQKARVVSYLLAEPRCSFEVASDLPPYCGVRGQALGLIEGARGLEILEKLLLRYLGGIDNALAQDLLSRTQAEVAIRLEPQSVYTWNYSARMIDSLINPTSKLCPE